MYARGSLTLGKIANVLAGRGELDEAQGARRRGERCARLPGRTGEGAGGGAWCRWRPD